MVRCGGFRLGAVILQEAAVSNSFYAEAWQVPSRRGWLSPGGFRRDVTWLVLAMHGGTRHGTVSQGKASSGTTRFGKLWSI